MESNKKYYQTKWISMKSNKYTILVGPESQSYV